MAKKVVRKPAPKRGAKKILIKIDPVILLTIQLVGWALVILFMFLSIYAKIGGVAGNAVTAFFKALFGDGVYYVPIISVYLYYAAIIHKKNKDNYAKIISSVALLFFISAGEHMKTGMPVDDLSLKNMGNLILGAQTSQNGGIIGTYIAEFLSHLVANIFANILIAFVNIAAIFIMFSELVAKIILYIPEILKSNTKEKTSNVFRLPGFKPDKKKPPKIPEKKLPDIEVPIEMEIPKNTDVVIEKFTDIPEKPVPEKKEPALSKDEKDSILTELENAKNVGIKEYKFPSLEFLNISTDKSTGMTKEELTRNAQRLISTLGDFGVEAEIVSIQEGPAVTRYEIRPQIGVKISRILGLSDDIALRMAAKGIRIAPIPGKTVIGVEIANQKVMPVFVREVIDSKEFRESKSKISFALGKDIAGTTIVGDIGKMPHVLIAGATNSGKSVCVNALITSILYKSSPEEVKFIMIDPKVVELSVYNGIPHLLIPVVTDPRKAAGALNWAVMEMLNRYKLFEKCHVRNLEGYNEVQEASGEEKLPQIVIIVDELADLMVASPKEVEEYICRLAQLARAAGMHLVIATQRPSVDVITGLIKANVPSRIAFSVSSQIDSRTILDMAGAEKLLGRGDMLFSPIGESKPIRVQGAFIHEKEIEKIVNFLKETSETTYDEDILGHIESAGGKDGPRQTDDSGDADEMLSQCVEFVVELGEASVSKLQRRFKLGYGRAARIIDQMEERGIVGPSEGSKPRQVLITKEQYLEMSVTNPDYA